jgi:hypothetical protein
MASCTSRQEKPHAEKRATPGVLRTFISPPIRSVSILAMVSPSPAPGADAAAALPRAKGSKMRSMSSAVMPGPVSSISITANLARIRKPQRHLPAAVNLMALPSRLMRIWRTRFSSARTTSGRRPPPRSGNADPFPPPAARTCRPSRAGCRQSAWACACSVSLPASMWAMASVPSMSDSRCSPPRLMTPPPAGGAAARNVFAHQLRVAKDAVQRRAQLVADGADVAALGLVGLVGGAAGLLGRELGLLGDFARLRRLLGDCNARSVCAVQLDLAHQQVGLAVRFFLRHLAALVRQHQPPGHDARDHQQRHVGLQKARAQRRPLHARQRFDQLRARSQLQRAFAQRTQLLLVEHAEHHGQQRHDDQHQQQEVAEAGVEVAPAAARQQPAQRRRPLRRQARMRLAQVAAARIERAAQRADRALVGRAMRHVGPFVLALADHACCTLRRW